MREIILATKEARSACFYSLEDVEAKKEALETVIRSWIALQEGRTGRT